MTHRTDQEEIDRRMSAWAESDAAIDALANSPAPRETAEGNIGLEIFRQAGRPRLDGNRSKAGRSPRRQVRLPDDLSTALDTYADQHDMKASEVMRQALSRFLEEESAA